MKNKQIIIDNIDVSGCKNFSCGKCEEENKIPRTINHFTADCRMYPNCYYKQLERVKQENKRLLDIINAKPLETVDIDSSFEIEKLKEQLQAKEQECEELKKELEAVYDDCKGCPTCNEALYNANLYAKECRKLKQTLAEIKEIAKQCLGKDFCTDCKYREQCYVEDGKTSTYDVCKSILQKISECEV